ncbi:MAG: TetR/AcrR family transcriptional regulator [Acidimicrobiales bacterium]|jgi:AcrR family transcriptional regulator|nr:TetR/AcrR family transcriptional regulator [Acidimicrobiales bacterium]
MNVRLPAAERRHQLLATALATFAAAGYHGASMNDIADAAGVTKPVLYQHFGSKRELFLEVLREVGDDLRERVRDATEGAPSPHQQVRRGFEAWFGWVAERRDGFTVLFAGDVRRDPEFMAEAGKVERQIADNIADLIVVDGLSEERRRLLAYGIVGLGESTCRRWLAKEIELDADDLAAQVAEMAWAGLRGLRPE